MQSKTANLASIMFPYLLFISASSFLGAILNAKKRFLMWAFLPIILNLFMVLGMLLAFYNSLDITKVLAFSVIISGVFTIYVYFYKSKIFKNPFFCKKTRNNPSCKKIP